MPNQRSLWLAATLLAAPTPALAQQTVGKEMTDPAQTLTVPDKDAKAPSDTGADTGPDTGEVKKKKTKPELLIVPIPMSSPALGTGLTVAAVLFYNPNDAPQPWVSGVGAGYTSTKTWGGGLFHSMSLGHDKVRILGFAGYGDARLNFYGIGPDAGSSGRSVDLEDKAFMGLFDGQMRLFKHVYFGARFEYLKIDSKVTIPAPPSRPDLNLPPLELKSTLSQIGPAFTYDSRDSSLNPRKGVYVTSTLMFGADFLGSDFEDKKFNFAANVYIPLAKQTVVAARAFLCGASNRAPFYDLCMFGQGADLRGYETGRYRDGGSWALQAEIRQHLFWKLGIVAFAGVGGVAPSLGDIADHSTVLTSGGAGLRFLASKRNNVNVRLDVAFGKDGHAIYFGIGEAF